MPEAPKFILTNFAFEDGKAKPIPARIKGLVANSVKNLVGNKLNQRYNRQTIGRGLKLHRKIKDLSEFKLKYHINGEPRVEEPDIEKVIEAEKKLREANNVNAHHDSLKLGISEEDTITLLNWVVYNGRVGLNESLHRMGNDIYTCPLTGACGFSQSLTGFPLESMGADVKITNVGKCISPNSGRHAFLIAGFPVEIKGEVKQKYYLVDITYRQFCISNRCTTERFICNDKAFKGKATPDPGYFIGISAKGREVANQLLVDGYFELTPENAKLYGDSFFLTSRGLDYYNGSISEKSFTTNITGEGYIEAFRTRLEEHDYSRGEFETWGYNIETPLEKHKKVMNIYK